MHLKRDVFVEQELISEGMDYREWIKRRMSNGLDKGNPLDIKSGYVTSEKSCNLMGVSFDCDEDVFLGAHAEVFGIVEHVGGIA